MQNYGLLEQIFITHAMAKLQMLTVVTFHAEKCET